MSLEAEVQKLNEITFKYDTVSAIQYMKEIEEKVLDGELNAENNQNKDLSDYEYFHQFPCVKLLSTDENLYFRCLDNLKKVHKKAPDDKENGIDSWYFVEDDSNIITTVHKFIIKAPLMRILNIIFEPMKLKSHVKDLGNFDILKEISDYRSLVKARVKVGFGYTDRMSLNYGNTFLNSELKTALFLTKSLKSYQLSSINSEEIKFDLEDCEEIDLKFSYYTVKKTKDGRYEVTTGLNGDAKLTGIPDFVCNKVVKAISYNISKLFKKLFEEKTMDKFYEGDYEKRKDLYDQIIKIIEL